MNAFLDDLNAMLARAGLSQAQLVDIAPVNGQPKFEQFDDVEIAFGWKTIDQVLSKREPEDLGEVLSRLASRLSELHGAFLDHPVAATICRIERAAQDRGRAFVDRLRALAPSRT